jgi:hypothetical protein
MDFIASAFNAYMKYMIESAFDTIDIFNKGLIHLLDIALDCQGYMTKSVHLKGVDFSKINAVILKFALALIILKFLQKGFNIYILQTDGDADHDPFVLLTGFFEALAISLTFLGLYSPLMKIFKSFSLELLKAISSKDEIKSSSIAGMVSIGGTNLLLILIFVIMVVILYVNFIMTGAELLILKYSIAITSVGLMDSDGGAFKVAVKKFFQAGFTCTLQVVLLRFSFAMLLTEHPVWAVAFAALAIKTPKLIQEFLFVRTGGGGGKMQMLANIKRLAG